MKTLSKLEMALRNAIVENKQSLIDGQLSYDDVVQLLRDASESVGEPLTDSRALLGRVRWFCNASQIPIPKHQYMTKDGQGVVKKDALIDKIEVVLGIDCSSLAGAKKPVLRAILNKLA